MDDDFDEAPTAMFVHPVKYTYDPDAPPAQPGVLDDDEDEDEPPTAIHTSPYRSDGSLASPLGEDSFGPMAVAPAPVPAHPTPPPARAQVPSAHAPLQAQGAYPAKQVGDPRMYETQQAQSLAHRNQGQTGSGLMTPTGNPMATYVDVDAAPVWLKAVTLSSVVSAVTVLGVLGWMLSSRF